MAKILFAAGIEEVSGALSKINTKSMHRYDQNMFLATHRRAATMSLDCQRAYYRKINSLPWNKNVVTLSDETVAIRTKFATSVRAISDRSQDLSKKALDIAAFKAYREAHSSAQNYTTNKFYWLGANKYWNADTQTVDWPSGAIELD